MRHDIAMWGGLFVYALVAVLSWATNYPLMKLAVQDMPPLTFSAVRLFGGVLVMICMIMMTRSAHLAPPKSERFELACIGMLQFASVLGLASIALQHLPAGRTVTLIYSMALWAAIFDMLILKSRLRWNQYLGIILSVLGLVLFIDPTVVDWSDTDAVMAVGLSLFAAVCWGLGAVLYRRRKWEASVQTQTLWQLLAAGSLLMVAALLFEFPVEPHYTPSLVLILIWNWIMPTAVAVWAWSKILTRVPASIAGQLLMSTPFVGILFSAWIFDEQLSLSFGVSVALITLGGVLTLLRRKNH